MEVSTKEKSVVRQPEKMTNFISTSPTPEESASSGIDSAMALGCDNKTKFVSKRKNESVRLAKKLAHTFCFWLRFIPPFAITMLLIEKLRMTYRSMKNRPPSSL